MKKYKVFFLPTAHPCKKVALRALLPLAGQISCFQIPTGVWHGYSCCEKQLQCCYPAVQTEVPITHPGSPIQCSGLIWKCWWCCFTTWRLRGCAESSSACTAMLAWGMAAASSRAQQECSVTHWHSAVSLHHCSLHCFIGTRGRSAAPEQSALTTLLVVLRLASTSASYTLKFRVQRAWDCPA